VAVRTYQGFVATLQPDPKVGPIPAAYGGNFVDDVPNWGVVLDSSAATGTNVAGSIVCLIGVTMAVQRLMAGLQERSAQPAPPCGARPPRTDWVQPRCQADDDARS
jgi:hypothetical protein